MNSIMLRKLFVSGRYVEAGAGDARSILCAARSILYLRMTSSPADSKLFTPGPLNTTHSVKSAMLRDLGSRDTEFIQVVSYIRTQLLKVAGVCGEEYTTIPLQGSGTYSVEAAIQSTVPRADDSRVLVLSGGAYGDRIAKMCSYLSIKHDVLKNPFHRRLDLAQVEQQLNTTKYSNVAVVHCETTSGVINPVLELGALVKQLQPDCSYLIDAMSSFGAVELDMESSKADFLVSSANKCIQGVPAFGFVIAKKSKLLECKGNSRSLSLDLYDQYESLEKTGMFRFTPPTHAMLAFKQALIELEEEGGVTGRAERYQTNHRILSQGMNDLGFTELVAPEDAGYIIISFKYLDSPNFDFDVFYNKLKARGQVLYPGKMMSNDCFRVGNIGDIFPTDIHHLLDCVKQVCEEMSVKL